MTHLGYEGAHPAEGLIAGDYVDYPSLPDHHAFFCRVLPMRFRTAWGKAASPKESHSLINHSADVSAVFLALLDQPVWRSRVTAAAGRELLPGELECLGALVFLHDIGKLAPGFQAKSWPMGHGLTLIGHLEAGWRWTALSRRDALAGALTYLKSWPGIVEWFAALFAHHGRPVGRPAAGVAAAAFPVRSDYDWQDQETKLGQCFLTWFPAVRVSAPPSPSPRLVHLFCGLLTLSDWVASDRRAFPFEPETSDCYWQTAKQRARDRVSEIGLAACPELRGPATWALISDHPAPRPAQEVIGKLPLDERLVLLEAETGAGKTEAALWRFAILVAAGEVDALYFAVPTRAAARQLHRRINHALYRMFEKSPEAILAIPGQSVVGEAEGTRLPDFKVLWDDGADVPHRWAAEHSARYLAARVAVGTVDQVSLGGLQVKFAHLRGAALTRALLVIDEVHAALLHYPGLRRDVPLPH